MKRSWKGFTLVELLVVVGIISLLVMILMPTLTRARELAKQAICGANLNTVGKGIHIYMAEFSDKFPLITDHGDVDAGLSISTMADDVWEVSGADLTLTANAMQNFWMIIKTGTSEKAFQCPSDGDWAERKLPDGTPAATLLKKYGWISHKNFSYGLHKPYGASADDDVDNKAPLTKQRQGNFVILADKGNGKSIYCQKDGNGAITDENRPLNHPDDGFNFLTFQGSVSFHKIVTDSVDSNSKAGIAADDIYVAGDQDGVNSPMTTVQDGGAVPLDTTDSFIIPWNRAADTK